MTGKVFVSEVRAMSGMERPARLRAVNEVMNQAEPFLFGTESSPMLVRTSIREVDPTEPRRPLTKTFRVMLTVSPVADLHTLSLVIQNAPKLTAEQVAAKGLVDHREVAIDQLLDIIATMGKAQ